MKPKIIITGPGRSGTTSLVRILTRFGLDTGYTPENEDYRPEIRAGCEITAGKIFKSSSLKNLKKQINELPYILKSPEFSHQLKFLLDKKVIRVEHVIMPIRDLIEAATSRMNNEQLHWYANDIASQTNILKAMTGSVIEACVIHRIPLALMRFPDIVKSPEYCWNILYPVIYHRVNIPLGEFKKIFREVNG